MLRSQPLVAVTDVEATSQWYQQVLGCRSGHGGPEYEQLMSGDELILQLHDWHEDNAHEPIGDPTDKPHGGGGFDCRVKQSIERLFGRDPWN
jgi:catechol 2,3-dioxygenase-like lactoylglutathione lyase family enzyme